MKNKKNEEGDESMKRSLTSKKTPKETLEGYNKILE